MASSNQGKRLGPGAQNLAPGTQKKTDQTLQAVLQQQVDMTNNANVAAHTNTGNNNSNLFTMLRGYLDTLIQKVSNSNEAFARTEKLINNLSKKIDSALLKLEQSNKKPLENNQDSTKKLLEIFTKTFSKDDIQRIIISTDNINTKITELIRKNNESNVNALTNNPQTENAVLTFLKENETTNRQFAEKFNTSLTEFKSFISSIQTVIQDGNKDTVTSVNDIKSILTQFQVNIESITNKLTEYKSGYTQNFSVFSEKFNNTVDGLVKTINTAHETNVNIDKTFYNKIEQFLQNFQKIQQKKKLN